MRYLKKLSLKCIAHLLAKKDFQQLALQIDGAEEHGYILFFHGENGAGLVTYSTENQPASLTLISD